MSAPRSAPLDATVGGLPLHALGIPGDLPPPFCTLRGERLDAAPDVIMRRDSREGWHLASTVIHDAAALEDDAFVDAAALANVRLTQAIRCATSDPLVRVWNFIPGIGAPSLHGDRYMSFNAGRARAFEQLAITPAVLPAASGVGHAGTSLVVHGLTLRCRCDPLESPRQVPAWRYSAQYGPRPPLFSRGCRVHAREGVHLLISGTASVVGESSTHLDDLRAQLEETCANLEQLCRAAAMHTRALRFLRVHLRRDDESWRIAAEQRLHRTFPEAVIQTVVAPLCRPELLIEIEGTSWQPTTTHS